MTVNTNDIPEIQRFAELKSKIKDVSDTKIRLDDRLKTEKEKLEKLLQEISAKGYDPTKLAEIRVQKKAELTQSLDELEKEVTNISAKLSEIEAATNG
jgi:phage shock protein A